MPQTSANALRRTREEMFEEFIRRMRETADFGEEVGFQYADESTVRRCIFISVDRIRAHAAADERLLNCLKK